jgi:hypothetical protein
MSAGSPPLRKRWERSSTTPTGCGRTAAGRSSVRTAWAFYDTSRSSTNAGRRAVSGSPGRTDSPAGTAGTSPPTTGLFSVTSSRWTAAAGRDSYGRSSFGQFTTRSTKTSSTEPKQRLAARRRNANGPGVSGSCAGTSRGSEAVRHLRPRMQVMLVRLRLWFYRVVPFLDRWTEAAPACCGTCPTCVGTVATGATVTWFGSLRRG